MEKLQSYLYLWGMKDARYETDLEMNVVIDFQAAYGVPSHSDESDAFMVVRTSLSGIAPASFRSLCQLMQVSSDALAMLLGSTERTFRNYVQQKKDLAPHVSEHVLRLADLYKSGLEVFGSVRAFNAWLQKPHIVFDEMVPWSLLQTIGGVQLVQEEVQRIAYGDLA